MELLESFGVPSQGNKVTLAWDTTADLDFYVQNLNAPGEVTSFEDADTYAAKLVLDQQGLTKEKHVENIKLPGDGGNYAIFVNLYTLNDDEIEVPFTVVTQINDK